jgi:hypothetical protein
VLVLGPGDGTVWVGEGVGFGAGSLSATHARPLPDVVTADDISTASAWPGCAAVALTAAATSKPVAVARSTPPAARVTATGRACAKRMYCP